MISVIIPVYNLQKELDRCMDSVLGQTFSDYEVILVDDGSTDGSENLCDTFARNCENVFAVHQINAGLSAARNRGIREARGEYIAFVDGDDVLHPSYLETLHTLIEKHGADIAVCDYKRMQPKQISGFMKTQTIKKVEKCFSGKEAFLHRAMVHQAAWNKLYHRSIFAEERFTEGILHEDVDSYYRFLLSAKMVAYTDVKLYGYIMREDSISAEASPKRYKDWAGAAYRMLRYMEERNWPEGRFHAMEENSEFYCLAYFQWRDVYGKKSVADKIHAKYKQIVRANRDIKIPYRYRLFYHSPALFYQYMKCKEKAWYSEVVLGQVVE
ncbi:MAG: glycosyltransferase [Lachnospiraceae bacterium]|nr:glycosyltransferase [Lachnospiraceae bacterium]